MLSFWFGILEYDHTVHYNEPAGVGFERNIQYSIHIQLQLAFTASLSGLLSRSNILVQ
jgi:hypothetical protein